MICPQCQRQIGNMTRCPACNIEVKVPERKGMDADEKYRAGIIQRKKSAARNQVIKKIVLAVIPLLLIGAVITALAWPVVPPPVDIAGEASMQLLSGSFDEFRDKVKFGELAHFELSEGQLNAAARESMDVPGLAIKLDNIIHLYLPRKKFLTFMLQIDAQPSYAGNQLKLQVVNAKIGKINIPGFLIGRIQSMVDTFAQQPQFQPLLEGVTALTLIDKKVKLDFVPSKAGSPGNTAGWQIIN